MGDIRHSRFDRICMWFGEDSNWRPIVIALFLVLAVVTFSGCASTEARLTMHVDAKGDSVEVLELQQDCPRVIADTVSGCALMRRMYVTFHPPGDEATRWHELDHIAGLVHGAWENGCAPILSSGQTVWKVGYLMCRAPNGTYFQRRG